MTQGEELLQRQFNLEEAKADLLLEFLKSGMDWKNACIASEIDDDRAKQLLDDKDFTTRMRYYLAKKEAELLQKLNEASMKAAEAGNTKGIERLLEILRPDRYGKHSTITVDAEKSERKGIKIAFVGTNSSREDIVDTDFHDELAYDRDD